MFQKILVANNGSPQAKKALQAAFDIADQYGSEVHQICVQSRVLRYPATVGEVVEAMEESTKHCRHVIEESEILADAYDVRLVSHVIRGEEAKTIVTWAKEHGVDLLVVPFTENVFGFTHPWGSISHKVTKLSPCSVLTVK